jgi:signal transduction histidine kinase
LGAFLAKMTLRPVQEMINTIHEISAENMKLRLASPGTRDEIQDLAETFNVMLCRLEDSFRSQKRLFEDVSHELKTPLTIMKGEFELSLKKARSQQEYEAAIRSALDETNRIIRLSETLLMLARLDSKEVFFEKKTVDLNDVLQKIVNSMRPLADLKEIRMLFKPCAGLSVNGDEDQLKTLFMNLIDNAIKYTPEKGEIWVVAGNESGAAVVRVKDSGSGIPEDKAGHIFDRFYRGEKASGSGGFGLGLSIARAIAVMHGGDVRLENAASSGATFTVSMPAIY